MWSFDPYNCTLVWSVADRPCYIPELDADPALPNSGDTWVLKISGRQPELGHTLLQIGLSLGSSEYFLKYKTLSGTVIKTKLEV